MTVNEKLVKKHIRIFKMLISKIKIPLDDALIGKINIFGRQLSLVVSGFRCQKCKDKENLQFHHLISRFARDFVNDDVRYVSQRHYWANVIVLCRECHARYHGFKYPSDKCISEEKILNIKDKYGWIE